MGEKISEVLHDRRASHWHTLEAQEPEDLVAVATAEVVRLKTAVIVTSINTGVFWVEIKCVGGALEDSVYPF